MCISFSQWEIMGFPQFLCVYLRVNWGSHVSAMLIPGLVSRPEESGGRLSSIRTNSSSEGELISDNMAWRHHPGITLHIIFDGSFEVNFRLLGRCSNRGDCCQEKRMRQVERRARCQGARKGRKVAEDCVFPMFCGSKGLMSRLAKAAGAEPSGHMRDQKMHSAVARSTFANQKC